MQTRYRFFFPTFLLLSLLLATPSVAKSKKKVAFLWSGGLGSSSIVIKAKLHGDSDQVRIAISESEQFYDAIYAPTQKARKSKNNRLVSFAAKNLTPNTQYFYAVEVDGELRRSLTGKFKTPSIDIKEFTVAFGSCSNTGSNHKVFETILNHRPLFFLNTGDFHYADLATNLESLFRRAYDKVLKSPRQSRLYRETPIAYMWDDHDYGPNDSHEGSGSRTAARLTYQLYVPHYPLINGPGDFPVSQAFSIGRVRFILADLRSERHPPKYPDGPEKSMFGAVQKKWFKEELLAAKGRYPLIVWVNGAPWIDQYPSKRRDTWNGYQYERREIANFIKENQITGILMLSGDAHMLAIDNGDNSDYADGGGGGFPVMQAASLARYPSEKGGPFSEGYIPGSGQFGLMTITDNGSSGIDVRLSGRNHKNEELISYSFSVPS